MALAEGSIATRGSASGSKRTSEDEHETGKEEEHQDDAGHRAGLGPASRRTTNAGSS